MSLPLRWTLLAAFCLPLAPSLARAQQDPHARVAALRASGAADEATLRSIQYLLTVSEGPRRQQPWRGRAESYLALLERGMDPYAEARGEITMRAYRSELTTEPVGYAVYVPPDYDPSRRYPLLVALHGGSSNGNLFLALTLQNRVDFADYRRNWLVVHEPRIQPDWIIVAPDGFGNSMWRFAGERDVLDVVDDVSEHYAIDEARVVLTGLSNGGLGTFNIGMRHAERFSAVVPVAGAPGWMHYLGGYPTPLERRLLAPLSAWSLFRNAALTHLHVHHGRSDPGPMQPRHIEALGLRASAREIPFEVNWYPTGHDLMGPVHRGGHIFERELERRRTTAPQRVSFVTADYRANRQHWVSITRIDNYPSLAEVTATAHPGRVEVTTRRARALELDLGAAPLLEGPDGHVELIVDGTALRVPRAVVSVRRDLAGWVLGEPDRAEKRPALSGPLTDAAFESLVHVYGTLVEAHTATLRQAAELGSRGFIANMRGISQPVVADRDLSAEQRRGHLVLYGSIGDHAVLRELGSRLPIRVEDNLLVAHGTRYPGRRVGARFIQPSPFNPDRYLIVQTGTTDDAVLSGDRLPAFLPDWVVYDGNRLPSARQNLASQGQGILASGLYDDRWSLPGATADPEGVRHADASPGPAANP